MISSCNICFAYMGYILFGDKLDAFKTFDRSFFSLLGVLVGEGPSYAQLSDADGVGAFLLYVPYVLFFALIFTQLVVAVIVEAYQVPPPPSPARPSGAHLACSSGGLPGAMTARHGCTLSHSLSGLPTASTGPSLAPPQNGRADPPGVRPALRPRGTRQLDPLQSSARAHRART